MEDKDIKYEPNVVTSFTIRESQKVWLQTRKSSTGVNRSFIVQKALDLWIEREEEKDKAKNPHEFQPQEEGEQAA